MEHSAWIGVTDYALQTFIHCRQMKSISAKILSTCCSNAATRYILEQYFARKVPIVLQVGKRDCGPANLLALCRMRGERVGYRDVKELCRLGEHGTTVDSLLFACQSLGIAAEARVLDLFDLRRCPQSYLPAIVAIDTHDTGLHFITVHRFFGTKVLVMDPAYGALWWEFELLRWRLLRLRLSIPLHLLVEEETLLENRRNTRSRLRSLGLTGDNIEIAMGANALIFIDDCIKYVESVDQEGVRKKYGSAGGLLYRLLVSRECNLPQEFDSLVRRDTTNQTASIVGSPVISIT